MQACRCKEARYLQFLYGLISLHVLESKACITHFVHSIQMFLYYCPLGGKKKKKSTFFELYCLHESNSEMSLWTPTTAVWPVRKKKCWQKTIKNKIVVTAQSSLSSCLLYVRTMSQMDLFIWSRGLSFPLNMRFCQSSGLSIRLLLSQRGAGADGPLQQLIHPIP